MKGHSDRMKKRFLRVDGRRLNIAERRLLRGRRSSADRFDRRSARAHILDMANRDRDPMLDRLSMRHLQEAVCIVRRRRLVSAAVIGRAGFNPKVRR